MQERISFPRTVPAIYQAIRDLDAMVQRAGLDKPLMELVKIRASQINGCSFCLDMHTKDARAHGETEQRLYLLNAWREAPQFTDRERAALAWTESLTRISTDGAPQPEYEALTRHFSPEEIACLTALVGVINLWNRVAVAHHWPMPRAA